MFDVSDHRAYYIKLLKFLNIDQLRKSISQIVMIRYYGRICLPVSIQDPMRDKIVDMFCDIRLMFQRILLTKLV